MPPPVPGLAQALRVAGRHMAGALRVLRARVADAAAAAPARVADQLQPVLLRARPAHGPRRHPVHPAAWLRQQKRSFSHRPLRAPTASPSTFGAGLRRLLGRAAAPAARPSTFSFSSHARLLASASATARAVAQSAGRAPFASALRPNLTGGALPRTAGGYAGPSGVARGARFFSHGPAAPPQVVQNASQAMRAFLLQGKRARFDGETGPRGERRWRAVDATHEDARARIRLGAGRVPGSSIDFSLSPTLTAISPLGRGVGVAVGAVAKATAGTAATSPNSLHSEGFLDALSGDFARAVQDLAATTADLRRLAALGDLPVTLERRGGPGEAALVLRVRLPGVDADTAERLCADVELRRGVVRQDADFCAYDEEKFAAAAALGLNMGLRFPHAPQDALMPPGASLRSRAASTDEDAEEDARLLADGFMLDEYEGNPWLASSASPRARAKQGGGGAGGSSGYQTVSLPGYGGTSGVHCSEDFEGLEGIYRFIEECDHARGKLY